MAEPIYLANPPLSTQSMAAKEPKTTPVCRLGARIETFQASTQCAVLTTIFGHRSRVICSTFLALLLPLVISAQTGALRGQITDQSGAIVTGATVVLTGPDQKSSLTTTDSNGSYSFPALAPGNYTIQASAAQLALPQPAKVSVKAATQTLNLQLRVVSVTQRVTVQDTAGPSVSTAASNNASAVVLTGDDLQALSDDPDDLLADLQALAGPAAGPNGGSIFIDGFSGGELPPKESIREIRINQNPFAPEYDKLGLGRIEIFTKPGADKYRGNVNYNLGTQAWNSRNPYADQKAPFLLQEFEGTAGGPLSKRASFTLDAQRNMVDNGSITNGVVVNPQTFAIDPFNSVITTAGRYTRATPRVDYQLSPNHTLMFRYGVTRAGAQDAGIGGFDLISRGYATHYLNQTVQAAETAVLGSSINETRFQYYRSASQFTANTLAPAVQVLGAFNGGGATNGGIADTQNSFELQNYTSGIHHSHSWKFGVRLRGQTDDSVAPQNFNGTFTFGGDGLGPALDANNQPLPDGSMIAISPVERYRRTLLFEQMGLTPDRVRALGGGATQFTLSQGMPELAVHQMDAGIFAGDDWRAKPNLTLSFGMRYETQTNISDHRDIAPRVAVAWAPHGKNGSPKTVVRAGFGMFYDRFPLSNTLTAQRYNGVVQQQYVVTNPDFFPALPSVEMLAGFQGTQTIQEISSRLRAPYLMQSVASLERQLPANTTLALTYTNSHGVHTLRSNDINAPFPGSGAFPLGRPGPVFLMESSGLYNQNQLITNVNSKLNSGFSLFGFYVLNRARSNADGIGTFPANPYNFSGEYGPALTDVRHRGTIGGSINMKWNIRISPFVVLQSGAPFDITSGSDLYGTTLFNARPGFASASAGKPGLVLTPYGLLDPNPSPGEPLVPRNYGRGPALLTVNLRLAKTIGFGAERKSASESRPAAVAGAGAAAAAASGGGIGRIIGTPSTSRRYNLTISMSIRNLLNHNNPGPIIGNITSPLFGMANQIAGSQNGEGFYETANNRRLELQIKFAF
ncbi:MAG TPA: carboxypeptidase regulatory-like domain-containing protein [Bryobacteraceae bacterium]|nr:carboxypeptidase regulatory-like domain-containing protein [Bryobacteraceae bacterium]